MFVSLPVCSGVSWASSPRRTFCDTWLRWWTRIQSPSCSTSRRAKSSTDGVNRWNWCNATVQVPPTSWQASPDPQQRCSTCFQCKWQNALTSVWRLVVLTWSCDEDVFVCAIIWKHVLSHVDNNAKSLACLNSGSLISTAAAAQSFI